MGIFRKLKNKAKTKSQQRGGASGGYRGRRVKDHREPDPKPPKKIKIAKMPKKVKKQKPMSIERLPKKPKSLLEDESRMYRGSRIMYNEGEYVDVTAEKRYNSFINQDIKYLKELGDDYYNAGSSGLFKRTKQALGDFGKGERLLNDLKQVRREMGDDRSDTDLLNMINTQFKDSGLNYTVSDSFINKEKKYDGGKINYDAGGPVGDLDKDGTLNEYEQARQDAIDSNTRVKKEMGGMMMEEQLPDTQMEDDYMGFIINEALTDEEEDMLMSKLEQDNELSLLFDKVVDVAQEFAGSGPVEGPGSGVSDSIPARLSDGEFVFTAKAVEEIGSDNLMSMMKEAEAQAEERQQVAMGGMLDSGEEEVDANTQRQTVILDRGFVPEDEDLVGDEIKKRMMDPSTQSRYVRS